MTPEGPYPPGAASGPDSYQPDGDPGYDGYPTRPPGPGGGRPQARAAVRIPGLRVEAPVDEQIPQPPSTQPGQGQVYGRPNAYGPGPEATDEPAYPGQVPPPGYSQVPSPPPPPAPPGSPAGPRVYGQPQGDTLRSAERPAAGRPLIPGQRAGDPAWLADDGSAYPPPTPPAEPIGGATVYGRTTPPGFGDQDGPPVPGPATYPLPPSPGYPESRPADPGRYGGPTGSYGSPSGQFPQDGDQFESGRPYGRPGRPGDADPDGPGTYGTRSGQSAMYGSPAQSGSPQAPGGGYGGPAADQGGTEPGPGAYGGPGAPDLPPPGMYGRPGAYGSPAGRTQTDGYGDPDDRDQPPGPGAFGAAMGRPQTDAYGDSADRGPTGGYGGAIDRGPSGGFGGPGPADRALPAGYGGTTDRGPSGGFGDSPDRGLPSGPGMYGAPGGRPPTDGYGDPADRGPSSGFGPSTDRGPAGGFGPSTDRGPAGGFGASAEHGPTGGFGGPGAIDRGPASGFGGPPDRGLPSRPGVYGGPTDRGQPGAAGVYGAPADRDPSASPGAGQPGVYGGRPNQSGEYGGQLGGFPGSPTAIDGPGASSVSPAPTNAAPPGFPPSGGPQPPGFPPPGRDQPGMYGGRPSQPGGFGSQLAGFSSGPTTDGPGAGSVSPAPMNATTVAPPGFPRGPLDTTVRRDEGRPAWQDQFRPTFEPSRGPDGPGYTPSTGPAGGSPAPSQPAPVRTKRRGLRITLWVAVAVLVIGAGALALYYTSLSGAPSYKVGTCVAQKGSGAAQVSCGSQDAYKVASKVSDPANCPDPQQPFVKLSESGKTTYVCLTPAH